MAGRKPPSPELLADFQKALPAREAKKLAPKKPAPAGPKKLPPLGSTPESVQHYMAALACFVEDGHLTTGTAKSLTDAANTHLRAVRARMAREEIETLEAMLREAKELRKDGMLYEDRCRKHKEEPLLGKWLEIEHEGGKAWVHASK
jgi:histone deacetylase complex regulatory component SIN3